MCKDKNMAISLKAFKGFTLMELMIVVVIMGIIAAFSIPNYSKAVERSYERDGMVNLMAIYTSQKIYYNNNNTYAGGKNISELNASLELGLISNGMSYACNASSVAFECTATRGNTFILKVNKETANPCCAGGDCPSISKCGSTI